jgi:hypothetical protein
MIGLQGIVDASLAVHFEDFRKVQDEEEEALDLWDENILKDFFYDLSSAMLVDSAKFRERQEMKYKERKLQKDVAQEGVSKVEPNRAARRERRAQRISSIIPPASGFPPFTDLHTLSRS